MRDAAVVRAQRPVRAGVGISSSRSRKRRDRRNLQLWRRLAQVGEIGLLRDHEAASAAAAR